MVNFIEFIKEGLRYAGEIYQSGDLDFDLINNAIDANSYGKEIESLMKKNPGITLEQARLQVYFENYLINRYCYDIMIEKLKREGKYVACKS